MPFDNPWHGSRGRPDGTGLHVNCMAVVGVVAMLVDLHLEGVGEPGVVGREGVGVAGDDLGVEGDGVHVGRVVHRPVSHLMYLISWPLMLMFRPLFTASAMMWNASSSL